VNRVWETLKYSILELAKLFRGFERYAQSLGVLPEKLGEGMQLASENLYPNLI